MKLHNILKVLIICMFLLSLSVPSFAAPRAGREPVIIDDGAGGSGGSSLGANFDTSKFESSSSSSEVSNLASGVLGQAVGAVRIIGAGIAIIILTVIGCKYMIASPGDRADIKKHAVPFVIGAFVLFAASGILGIIVDFASNVK